MSNLGGPVLSGFGGITNQIIRNLKLLYATGRVWEVDLGVTVIDTSSGGTQRTTTLSAWMSTSNDSTNAPQSAWTHSYSASVNWTSASSVLVPGAFGEPARLAAIAAGLQNLLVTVQAAVTAAGLIPV
jgi:hypothetical protein